MPSELSNTSPLDLTDQWRIHRDAMLDPDLTEALNGARSYWDGISHLLKTDRDLRATVKFIDMEYGEPWLNAPMLVTGTMQEVNLYEQGCWGVPVAGSEPQKTTNRRLVYLGFTSLVSEKTDMPELYLLGLDPQSKTTGKHYAVTLDSSVAFMSGGSEVHVKAVLEKYAPGLKQQIDEKLENQTKASGKSLLSLRGLDLSELDHLHAKGDIYSKVLNDMCDYIASESGFDAGVGHVVDYSGSVLDPNTGVLYELTGEQIAITPHQIMPVSVPSIDNPNKPNSSIGILSTLRSAEYGSDLQVILFIDSIDGAVTMREFLSSDIGQVAMGEFMDRDLE